MKRVLFSLLAAATLASCCPSKGGDGAINVKISSDIANKNYIGNGAQWDAYPEAEQWGAKVSDEDWNKLYTRLDFMRPQFVRCLINSPFRYFDAKTGKYDKTRNIESLSKLLSYCQKNNITVLFGEYNPPKASMYMDTAWVSMAVDYLNYLVNDKGFTCIKYYNFFNEPDGNWTTINGDFDKWATMIRHFDAKMAQYPGLKDKVALAGPDAVMDYKNGSSKFDTKGWIEQTRDNLGSLMGIYDVHAYPGQKQVRSGEFAKELQSLKSAVPAGKQVVLGEAGYKYWRSGDEELMAEYNRRAKDHPFTKGSDANMLVYDYFYGLDMALLGMEVMNNGFSGMAVWMLDDAMHSTGDAGNTKDIKLWGMWNILGEEVFGRPEEEAIRPWYYTWSLMCRYFPAGSNILAIEAELPQHVKVVAGVKDGKYTVAVVNVGKEAAQLNLHLPKSLKGAKEYLYTEGKLAKDANELPIPSRKDIKFSKCTTVEVAANSFYLLTNME